MIIDTAPIEATHRRLEQQDCDKQLWSAVISQALEDATALAIAELTGSNKKRARIRARFEARDWLTSDSTDFRQACAFAGVNPEAVAAHARRAIAQADLRLPPDELERPARSNQIQEADPRATLITWNDDTLTVADWATRLGLKTKTLHARLKSMQLHRAMTKAKDRPGGGSSLSKYSVGPAGVRRARDDLNRISQQ